MIKVHGDLVKEFKHWIFPGGVASYVSDTFDFSGVLTEIAPALKQEILDRKPNGLGLAKVVFRPDSGDPVKILTGYRVIGDFDSEKDFYWKFDGKNVVKDSAVKIAGKFYEAGMHDMSRVGYGRELTEAEVKGAVEVLWDEFGGDVTDKGYKLLNQRVGLIYGDSICVS